MRVKIINQNYSSRNIYIYTLYIIGAPPPWHGLRIANKLPPVCPQKLPKLNITDNQFSKGRYKQLERLMPYLDVESEDCLYLNLYVPSWGKCKLTNTSDI